MSGKIYSKIAQLILENTGGIHSIHFGENTTPTSRSISNVGVH